MKRYGLLSAMFPWVCMALLSTSSCALAQPDPPGECTLTGSMTTARKDQAMALLLDGRVLVAGGRATNSWSATLSSAEVNDSATGARTSTSSMIESRTCHFAVLMTIGELTGKLLVGRGEKEWACSSGSNLDGRVSTIPIWGCGQMRERITSEGISTVEKLQHIAFMMVR